VPHAISVEVEEIDEKVVRATSRRDRVAEADRRRQGRRDGQRDRHARAAGDRAAARPPVFLELQVKVRPEVAPRRGDARAARPDVPGTGAYDAGGDPVVAFSPDGRSAYFVCQAFNFISNTRIQLLLNRGTVTNTGITWQTTGLTPIATWNGNGKTKGGNGQFPDHESIHVDPTTGRIYVTWAQFDGLQGTHSPVLVATSTNGGRSFSAPVKVSVGSIRNNQDQRIVTDENGNAYLTFDNGVQGGKGTVLASARGRRGRGRGRAR
jgi:hypothetical protein